MLDVVAGALGGAAGNAASGVLNAGIQYATAKSLAKYNYELGQRSLVYSPGNYKKGLIRAGINPILAASSPVGATQGSSGVNPGMEFAGAAAKGASAVQMKKATDSQIALNDSTSKANLINAEANMKNAETNEKSLYIGGVNAGANAVGTVGKLATAGNTVVATPGSAAPKNVSSAKGMNGAVTVPSATSSKAVDKIPSRILPFVSTIGLPTAAVGLGAAGLSYGVGKYMESKGLGSTFDKGANKNELRHRTGGLGSSSSSNKLNSHKRRHN